MQDVTADDQKRHQYHCRDGYLLNVVWCLAAAAGLRRAEVDDVGCVGGPLSGYV